MSFASFADVKVGDQVIVFNVGFNREDAEKARDLIEECLNKFHEEND